YKYRMTHDCRRTSALPDGQQSVVDERTQSVYSWHWQGNEAALVLHRIDFEVSADDQLAMKSSMTRSRRVVEQDDVTLDDAFADLNPQWQEVLESSFDTPLCNLVIDDGGNQLQRTVTDRPGAKMVIDRGIVANARLFQGPFPSGRNAWEAAAEIAVPHYASGTLAYEIVDPPTVTGDDLIEVHVSGKLVGTPATGSPGTESFDTEAADVGNVSYTLEGTVVYSRRMQQWIAGNLEAELTFDAFLMGQKIPTLAKVVLSMTLLSSETVDTSVD
ncbi:MAG TPA: hypothetical protein VE890_00035, partial [Thermoguttaceae bacterium]|nr:hypothetical protein [Thermoguttaceae bacterium]